MRPSRNLLKDASIIVFKYYYLYMSYPLYIPPEQFWGTKNSEWSLKEAKEYFNWFISIKDDRLDDYLEFLSVERNNIDNLCHKMLDLLFDPEFSHIQDGGKLDLTNAGYAFAADTSLFVSEYIINKYQGKVHWNIVKKPKSVISYHLPALFGFVRLPYIECMRGAFANAHSILWGEEKDKYIWRRMTEIDHLFS